MLQQNNNITKNIPRNKTGNETLKFILDVIQHVLILITFLMFFSFVQVATAEENAGSALIMHTKNSKISLSALMVKTDIDMRISGMINRAHVTQIFKNNTREWVEGEYLFPLPQSAVVDALQIQMGGREIFSEIKSNKQADKRYTNAKKSGKRTALLEQYRPNIFSSKIANIAPGEEIRIEISFQYLAEYEHGEFRLRFPLAVVPRYIPGVIASEQIDFDPVKLTGLNKRQLDDIHQLRRPLTKPDKHAPISLHIELDAGFPLVELDSRYHAIHKTNHGFGRYSIRFKFGAVLAKRDFELFWRPEPGHLPRTAIFHEQLGDEHYYFAMLYPQQPELSDQALLNKEVVYVIDTSGSMAGASIRQARQALLMALTDLDPEDYFNVITFNSKTHTLFEQSKPASVLNVARARQFVAQINARGGTEMIPALKKALSVNDTSLRFRQIIYMTDGAVINEQEVFDLLSREIKQSRLFTIGIGMSPNSYLLRHAARMGNGTYTYISNVNEISLRLNQLFKKINRPVLQDIKVEFPSGLAEITPRRIPDLYANEPVVFSMKAKEPVDIVNILGFRSGEQWSRQVNFVDSNNGFGVAKYWARQKIDILMQGSLESISVDRLEKSVTEISLKHKIMSPYTSLVVIDKSLQRDPSQKLYTHPIPANLATNRIIPLSTQTATDAQLKLMIGLISLLLAGIVRIFLRRREQNREWF